MDLDDIVSSVHGLLLNNLPVRTNRTPSGWMTFDCPMCGDRRRRAGVITNSAKISYNCFNCKYTTGWTPGPHMGKKFKKLANTLGATEQEIHAVQLNLIKHSEQLESVDHGQYVYNFAKFEPVQLPESAVSVDDLDDDHPVKSYARSRGILGLYPLLHIPEVPWSKRLIVPFTYNNELIGWTGRHINPPDKSTAKYLHKMPPGYVFNVDRFAASQREIVIVTEGVFDAVLLDGVAVMGNNVTAEQAHLISQLGKRVILCPDRDEPGVELIEQALALDWSVSYPPWDRDIKDAADAAMQYGRLLTVASIIEHATDNKLKARVKARMLT
jgi:hypothetical protein